jgi:hypothetical protein
MDRFNRNEAAPKSRTIEAATISVVVVCSVSAL